MSTIKEQIKVNWKRVVIFLIIAISISNIFRFHLIELNGFEKYFPNWIFILLSVILEGSGIFIGALYAIFLLKKERKTEISLFGKSKNLSLLIVSIPIFLLTIIGVKNEFEINSHLYGLFAVITTLLYCIMEEYGWRGYLQEEFKRFKDWQKYLGIGFLWYLWHLTFLTDATIGDNLFFLGMMIFGSWGIGQIAELTKSIVISAGFHLIIQIMMFNALIKNGINGTQKMIILGISIFIWIVILELWKKKISNENTNNTY